MAGSYTAKYGELKAMLLLSLVQLGPSTGDELRRHITDSSGGRYQPGKGAVTPRLHAMELHGLVRRHPRSGRHVPYEITPEGHVWMADNKQLVATSGRRLRGKSGTGRVV